MYKLSTLAVAASLVIAGMTAMPAAEAQQGGYGYGYAHRGDTDYGYGRHDRSIFGSQQYGYAGPEYQYGYSGRGWQRPEGYFIVYADLCPDLIEDRFDWHRSRGPGGRIEDWRDRQVLTCPDRAWDYVPSRNELRMGRTGDRLRPTVAYLDRRTGTYLAETRWGSVPVRIIEDRGYHRGYPRGYRSSGFQLRINL